MAAILKARDRMTRGLTTPYEVGQEVVLIDPLDGVDILQRPQVGDSGTIRKVIVGDPGDGDAAVPLFYTRFGTLTLLLSADEFADAAAYHWARRMIEGLAR